MKMFGQLFQKNNSTYWQTAWEDTERERSQLPLSLQSMCTSIASLKENPSVEETCLHLRHGIAKANKQVFDAARKSPSHAGMGTTLSCCILLEESLIYAHVGDSRLYRLRDDTLEQLTEDHSLRQTPPPRHVITRAIGNVATILPILG